MVALEYFNNTTQVLKIWPDAVNCCAYICSRSSFVELTMEPNAFQIFLEIKEGFDIYVKVPQNDAFGTFILDSMHNHLKWMLHFSKLCGGRFVPNAVCSYSIAKKTSQAAGFSNNSLV